MPFLASFQSPWRPRRAVGAWLLALAVIGGCTGQLPPEEVDAGDGGMLEDTFTGVAALAGPDLAVLEGALVQLDAHATRSLSELPAVLSWSQLDGPQVLLTNPAGPSPAFIAPLGPTTLTFRLRATVGAESTTDDVSVRVAEQPGRLPVYAQLPPDATGLPGREETFTISQQGDLEASMTWSARALCDDAPPIETNGTEVMIVLPETLPCAVRVDGVAADGRRAGPALRVYWPEGTERPGRSELLSSSFAVAPGELADVTFDLPPTSSETLRLWDASGAATAFGATAESNSTSFNAPAQKLRLLIAGERRRGPVSGGLAYITLDVTEGPGGNRAPTIASGPDRVVLPGGLFTLRPSASDVDGDEVTITIEQVLGPAATADEVTPGLYQAPDEEGVLLFHVRAFDGTVFSPDATVRVTVDENVSNAPPTLELETPRYVAPGQDFFLDARTAVDDSGYIERWTLAQDAEDAVIIVPEPIEVTTRDEAAFMLTAGGAGDTYHLRVSAFDAAGASTTSAVEVIVEQAGPWIDPERGDDATGNGTLDAPFASLVSALPVALRHRFPELRLVSGPHTTFSGDLPAGLSLVGGYQWDGIAYAGGGPLAELPIAESGLKLDGGGLSRVRLTLTAPGGALTASGGCGEQENEPCALSNVDLVATAVHEGPLLIVAEGAFLAVVNSTISAGASSPATQTAVDILPGAQVRLEGAGITGGEGAERAAVTCTDASLDVIGGTLRGAAAAERAVGIDGDGCDLQIVDATISGGAASNEGCGLRLVGGSVRVESDAVIFGADEGSPAMATAVELSGGDGPAELLGALHAASDGLSVAEAWAAKLERPRAELDGAVLVATGTSVAGGVAVSAEEVQLRDLTVSVDAPGGEAVALRFAVADGAALHGGDLTVTGATARGVALADTPIDGLEISDVFASVVGAEQATGIALGASTGIVLRRSLWEVSAGGNAVPTRGATLGDALLEDTVIRVGAPGSVLGVVIAQADSGATLTRSAVTADSTGADATAVRAAAPTTISSGLLRASGSTEAVALEARAASLLRHATLIATTTAVDLASASASLDAANSLFIAPTGILSTDGTTPLEQTVACGFDTDVAFDDGVQQVTGGAELINLPCPACFVTDTEGVLDEDARLLETAIDLIDRGVAAYADETDIDGDTRPQGSAPDIGCDEYVPPEE